MISIIEISLSPFISIFCRLAFLRISHTKCGNYIALSPISITNLTTSSNKLPRASEADGYVGLTTS